MLDRLFNFWKCRLFEYISNETKSGISLAVEGRGMRMGLKNNRAKKYLHQTTGLQFLEPTPLLAYKLHLS
jgi:hypothetical protein